MIELVSQEACIGCNICVKTCPQDVFDPVPNAAPVIARQEDCHTCNTCELYCPVDALYVHPLSDPAPGLDFDKIIAAGHLGAYAKSLGWRKGKSPLGTGDDYSLQLRNLRGRGEPPDPTDRVRAQLREVSDRNFI